MIRIKHLCGQGPDNFKLLGPYNLSGEWKGVMGDVVSGKHSVSLSAWNWIIERDSFLDFVPVVKDRQILAVIPKPPEVDPGLFIRLVHFKYFACKEYSYYLCAENSGKCNCV